MFYKRDKRPVICLVICASLFYSTAFSQSADDSLTHHFYPLAGLVLDSMHESSLLITSGHRSVFELTLISAPGFGNGSQTVSKLLFQIPDSLDEFTLKDSEIKTSGGYYNQLCRCQDRGLHTIESGNIRGIKAGMIWKVDVDVMIIGRLTGKKYHIEHSGIYTKSPNQIISPNDVVIVRLAACY